MLSSPSVTRIWRRWRRSLKKGSSGGNSGGHRGRSVLWKILAVWMVLPGSSLIPLWVLSLLLGRGSMVADLGGSLRQLVGLGQEQQPSFQADPCLLRRAGADADDAAWVVWDEWVACRRELLGGAAGDGDGAGWLATAPRHWGSGGSKAAAVLIELERAEARPLEWAVRQAMGNLPVAWKMVVVAGSEAVAATVEGLFDEEMGVGKVEVVRLPLDERKEDSKARLNRLLTSRDFYDGLPGDRWLFTQLDAAICAPQRHLLRQFVESRPRGYYGAPWPHRAVILQGGNGGFSLRTRAFVSTILERFPPNNDAVDGELPPEDAYFVERAAQIREQLPESVRAAGYDEELAFAVEAVYGVAPFGVHQFWTKVGPGVEGEGQDEQALEKLLESCPEALAILPPEVVRVSPAWREAVCGFEGDDVVRVSEAWTGEDVCDWDGRWGGDEGGDKRTK